MKIEIPSPKSLSRQHPVNRLPVIESSLVGGNGRPPVQPRQATQTGNVSMYDHLQTLKMQMEQSLEATIQWQ
jgi:hypothetical protein